ncbi:MAG: hypothetical protein WDZ80_04245 [Candidatus Paceibacterota bacterium]
MRLLLNNADLDYNNSEIHQIDFLLSSFPSGKKELTSFPSLSQCIGNKRMWSYRLGNAFYIDSNSLIDRYCLEMIASLSRSYLVIDDFLKDENLNDKIIEIGENWLNAISDKIIGFINKVGGDENEFKEQIKRTNLAYKARDSDNTNLVKNSIEKCEIFFNPYKLKSISIDGSIRDNRIRFLDKYFTACQLLDDFHDIEEDLHKKINHNLLTETIDNEGRSMILKNKEKFAWAILTLIRSELNQEYEVLKDRDNKVFNHYLNFSIAWLKNIIGYFDYSDTNEIGVYNLLDFRMNKSFIQEISKMNCKLSTKGILEHIRPEYFQADFYNGLK